MKRSYLLLIAALGFIIGSCAPKENAVPIDKSVPTAPISVPADLAAHDWAQTEWWYYTGHLQAADGRTFGFEVTFFRGRR